MELSSGVWRCVKSNSRALGPVTLYRLAEPTLMGLSAARKIYDDHENSPLKTRGEARPRQTSDENQTASIPFGRSME
jgi:hypothetical protein